MQQPHTLEGKVLSAKGWVQGRIEIEKDRIAAINGTSLAEPNIAANAQDCSYILPGFIDLHVHGGGGRDIMEGGDALTTVARIHASHGTTALLATTVTAPKATLETVLTAIDRYMQDVPLAEGSRILGVHLEGPYINAGKLGAQPDFVCAAQLEEIEQYLQRVPIRVVTLAPEINGHHALIRQLTARGVRVQIGHTLGSYEDGVAALAQGASGFTHLFNVMTGLQHRAPGIVGAALAHGEYAELIPDLLHVHEGAMKVALRAIPRLFCVTDATSATAMPDGEYRLGTHTVTKCLGGVRLADGTLAGSMLTMDQAFRNLVKIGLSLADASHRLSLYPADYLGLTDRGRIVEGAYADLVVFNRELELQAVYVEGKSIAITNVK
ncbi:MAG TPA: N-acetylglucosamine-6-phosphate deacetylase [Gammaproteobacteria bacterium]|nr:N-acetylglucosamine-6-phosphate deacetylase [Gammaproteobacteria bacterium]